MATIGRRWFIRGLATLPLASGGVALPSSDPIFAAIEKHKAAQAAFADAVRINDGDGPDVTAASDAELDARYEMHATVPKTSAGLVAYVNHWTHHIGPPKEGGTGDSSSGWEALPTIADALSVLFPKA